MLGCLELGSVGMEHDNHCISITAIGNKFVAHCCVNSLPTFQLVWTQDPFLPTGQSLKCAYQCCVLLLRIPYMGEDDGNYMGDGLKRVEYLCDMGCVCVKTPILANVYETHRCLLNIASLTRYLVNIDPPVSKLSCDV